MQPVGIEADVGYGDKSAQGLVECFTLDNFADRGEAILGMEIRVEHPLPHGNEEDHVALLTRVLLRDLQFNGLVGMVKGSKKWGDGLAHLEVDGAVLDLDHHVALEPAIERAEVVITGPGAVGLKVIPIEMIVVDKAAIKHHAAVRLERAGHGV